MQFQVTIMPENTVDRRRSSLRAALLPAKAIHIREQAQMESWQRPPGPGFPHFPPLEIFLFGHPGIKEGHWLKQEVHREGYCNVWCFKT